MVSFKTMGISVIKNEKQLTQALERCVACGDDAGITWRS